MPVYSFKKKKRVRFDQGSEKSKNKRDQKADLKEIEADQRELPYLQISSHERLREKTSMFTPESHREYVNNLRGYLANSINYTGVDEKNNRMDPMTPDQ